MNTTMCCEMMSNSDSPQDPSGSYSPQFGRQPENFIASRLFFDVIVTMAIVLESRFALRPDLDQSRQIRTGNGTNRHLVKG
jgi:hypothetical protein